MTNEMLSNKDVVEKIKIVCEGLGWKICPISDESYHVYIKARIEEAPSCYVSISYGRYPAKDRITVTARTDHDSSIYRYREMPLRISINALRPENQIMNEIRRRFIPQCLEVARKAEEIQNRHDAYQRSMESCLGRLKQAPLDDGEKRSAKLSLHLDSAWGSVGYGADNQLSLDFHSVPSDKAERILSILREPSTKGKLL